MPHDERAGCFARFSIERPWAAGPKMSMKSMPHRWGRLHRLLKNLLLGPIGTRQHPQVVDSSFERCQILAVSGRAEPFFSGLFSLRRASARPPPSNQS